MHELRSEKISLNGGKQRLLFPTHSFELAERGGFKDSVHTEPIEMEEWRENCWKKNSLKNPHRFYRETTRNLSRRSPIIDGSLARDKRFEATYRHSRPRYVNGTLFIGKRRKKKKKTREEAFLADAPTSDLRGVEIRKRGKCYFSLGLDKATARKQRWDERKVP